MKVLQTFLDKYPNELISYEGYLLKRRYVLLPDEKEAFELCKNCIDKELNYYYAVSTLMIGIFVNAFDNDRVYFKFGCFWLDKIKDNNNIINKKYDKIKRLTKIHLIKSYTDVGIDYIINYHINNIEYLLKRFKYVK